MMASSKMSALITVVLMILVAAATTKLAEGQGSTPTCASSLVPCANYLNSTRPPASCCDPLKQAVATQLECLCKLYENPSVLSAFKINMTQALELPGKCGIPGGISACNAQSPGSSSSEPPPGQPGNGVGKIAGTGLTSLLLALASLMLS